MASVLVLVLSSSAFAASRLVTVSHGDPADGCVGVGATNPPGTNPGINFPNAEVEPWLAANPRSTRNLVATWQQDRWSDGGAKVLGAGYSFDDGRTWGNTTLPFSLCAKRGDRVVSQFDRVSDPWNDFGPDGKAYAVGLVFNANDNHNGVVASTSVDGGRSWSDPRTIIDDPASDPTLPGDDKESVTADPNTPGVAYVVWDRLQNVACPAGMKPREMEIDDHPARGSDADPVCSIGPTFFSRTTDGGRTWSAPRVIVETPANEQTIGNVIVVNRRTGVLFDFFDYITADGMFHVEQVYSLDHGLHWSGRQRVQELESAAVSRPAGVVDPRNPAVQLRTGDILPEPAIDPRTGQLYVAWQDARFNGGKNDQVLISTSRDPLGRPGTWSDPKLVNPPADPAAFTAMVSVNNRGQVGVSFFDFRRLDGAPATILPTDTWLRTFSSGLELRSETHLSGSFNMLAAPVARGFFVGDYEALTTNARTGGFRPLWVQTNCADTSCTAVGNTTGAPTGHPDPTDVVTTRVGGGGGDDEADG
jgi:hypothetical protein